MQAGLWPNPELVLGGSSDFVSTNEGEGSANAGLAQPLPIFGRLARARDLGRVDVALALAEARDLERALIGDVQGSVVTYRGKPHLRLLTVSKPGTAGDDWANAGYSPLKKEPTTITAQSDQGIDLTADLLYQSPGTVPYRVRS